MPAGSCLVARLALKGIAFYSAYQAWDTCSVRKLNPFLHVEWVGEQESIIISSSEFWTLHPCFLEYKNDELRTSMSLRFSSTL